MDPRGTLATRSPIGRAAGRTIATILVTAAILGAGPGLVSAAVHTVSVRSEPNVFDAARLTVAVGATVTWLVAPGTVHTVTSGTYNASGVHPDGLFDSGSLTPGEEFAFTFTSPGEYPYVCAIHADSGMVGRVTVVEATVTGPPEEEPAGSPAPPSVLIVAAVVAALILVLGGARRLARRRP